MCVHMLVSVGASLHACVCMCMRTYSDAYVSAYVGVCLCASSEYSMHCEYSWLSVMVSLV